MSKMELSQKDMKFLYDINFRKKSLKIKTNISSHLVDCFPVIHCKLLVVFRFSVAQAETAFTKVSDFFNCDKHTCLWW